MSYRNVFNLNFTYTLLSTSYAATSPQIAKHRVFLKFLLFYLVNIEIQIRKFQFLLTQFINLFFQHFRAQGIDGSTLILLKEEHLVTTMKMRLGSVLKFKAALAKKMGSCPICLHCVHCHNELTNETTKEAANDSA